MEISHLSIEVCLQITSMWVTRVAAKFLQIFLHFMHQLMGGSISPLNTTLLRFISTFSTSKWGPIANLEPRELCLEISCLFPLFYGWMKFLFWCSTLFLGGSFKNLTNHLIYCWTLVFHIVFVGNSHKYQIKLGQLVAVWIYGYIQAHGQKVIKNSPHITTTFT